MKKSNFYLFLVCFAIQIPHGAKATENTNLFNRQALNDQKVSYMSGNYNIGAGEAYPQLANALTDLASRGNNGPVTFTLTSNYDEGTETYPINISYTGATAVNTITITDAGSNSLTKNITANISLNGAKYFILNNLTVINTNTTGVALEIKNDATYNTIQNCTIKGRNTSYLSGGVIHIGAAVTSGNDYNTIKNCNITSDETYYAANAIYADGTDTKTNDNITIENCNIYDFYLQGNMSCGIKIDPYNSAYTIKGNHFYQTASRYITSNGDLRAVYVASGLDGFVVEGNYIGGSTTSCGGTAWTQTGMGKFAFICLNVGNTIPSLVKNNVIKNMNITSSTNNNAIALISVSDGSATIIGNTLGDATTTDNITFTGSTANAYWKGIYTGSGIPGTIIIRNNTISGVTVTGTGTISTGMIMAVGGGTGRYAITGNTIGSATVANSISNSTNKPLYGIYLSSTKTEADSVSNNVVANLNSSNTGTSTNLCGIYLASGLHKVIGNQIYNLSTLSTSTNTTLTYCSVSGLVSASTSAGLVIYNNRIYNIMNKTTSATNVYVLGMYFTASTSSGSDLVERNLVYNIGTTSTGTGFNIYGMCYYSGTGCVIRNNMIRTGYNDDGTEMTAGNVWGFNKQTGGTAFIYHNSIYVGGSNVSAGNSYGLSATTTGDIVKNNIVVNARSNGTGTGWHAGFVAVNSPTLDFNLIYVPGTEGYVGYQSSIKYDWAGWIGLGYESHGVNADPLYLDPTGVTPNLHLNNNSPADIVGDYSISDVYYDFDNQDRDLLTPYDIGADAGIFDTNPPSADFTPNDEETGVLINSSIQISFNEMVRKASNNATLTNGNASTTVGLKKVSDNSDVAFDVSYDADLKLLTIAPSADLEYSTEYQILITDIEDISGNFIGAPTTSTFTTAALVISSVSGSWDNPAVWGGSVPGPGDNVVINAGVTITIPSSKATVECNDLTLSPLSSLSIDGTLTVNGNLLIESDVSGSGSLIDKGTMNVVGNQTVQIYINQSDRYYYIAVPMAGIEASNFGDIANSDFLYVRNITTSSWERITTGTEVLSVGKGYAIRLTGAPLTLNLSGNSRTSGNFDPTLLYVGDRWNLIGNPYPSPIDWGTENSPVSGWTMNNVRNIVYVKHGPTFAIWNGAEDGEALNGGTRYIPAMQSFWLKAEGALPAASMSNLIRVHNGNLLMKANTDLCQKLRVKVARDGYTDEALLKFHSNAETWIDKLDAEKMFATDAVYPQLYMTVENEKQAIASHPLFSGVYHQPLAFKTDVDGQFTFTFTEMESFGAATELYLEDKAANKMVNLNQNSVYAFESGICDTENRFVIHIADGTTHFNPFDYPGTTGIDGLGVNVNVYGHQNSIFVKAEKAISATVKVYNLLGAEIASVEMNGDFAKIDMTAKGHYVVKVLGSKISKVEKVNIE